MQQKRIAGGASIAGIAHVNRCICKHSSKGIFAVTKLLSLPWK